MLEKIVFKLSALKFELVCIYTSVFSIREVYRESFGNDTKAFFTSGSHTGAFKTLSHFLAS